MQRPAGEDQELIDIFLEEAREVLGIMRDNLEICQLHPGSIDPLVTIRRGFHTLKGSGRMVGLTELGEVAWCVERAMNKWLQENKPATTGLLRFINAAVQAFAGWVEVLSNQGELHIEAGGLIATAQQIENGLYAETSTAVPAESADASKVEVKPAPITEPVLVPEPEPAQLPDLDFEPAAVPVSESEQPPAEKKAGKVEPELEPALLPDLDFESVPVSESEQSPAEKKAEVEPEPAPAAEAVQLPDLEFNFEIPPAAESAPPPSPASDFDFKLEFEPETLPEPDLAPAATPEPELDAVSESAEEVVMVGEIAVSKALFNIASSEAVQNVAILQEQFDALSAASHPVVQYDFMRAAHTLVGLNRTMGFEMVVALAYALENWLRARMDQPFTLSEGRLHMLEQAITVLGEMVLSICDQQMPQSHSDLVGQLHADIDKLGATVAEPLSIPDAELQSIKAELLRPTYVHPEADMPQLHEEMGGGGTTVPGSAGISEPALRPEAPATDKPAEVQAEIEESQVQDDIDEQLLPVFLEEADDLCPKIGEGLRVWRENPHDEQQVQSLKRLLHTMKGSSRMVGAMRIGETAHEMEDMVSAAAQIREETGYWDSLDSDFDLIIALLEELRGGKAVVMPTKAAATEVAEIRKTETGRRATDKQGNVRIGDRRATDHVKERAALGNVLRVRSEVVDKLVNDAGEISVARSRMEAELRSFKDSLLELTASVMRLRHQLREVEIQAESQMQARVSHAKDSAAGFDPLEFDRFTRLQELTRFMNESVHDVQTIQHTLLKNLDETSAVLQVQGRLSRELQQNLMNVRMVSFNSIADRLYRIVRQTGKELNKRANLELQGTGVELDRSVLEKMVAPFEHLLRNSIVHGLENDLLRAQSGKLPIGEIRLSVRQESNEIVFEFSDDGAGLNYAKLREKAIANGTFQAEDEVSEDQLAQLIFIPGLSTASEITENAGRGVGMDVVRSEISALGGTIDVKSKSGQGTQFIIRLPLTLAVTQILLVRSGESTYAIPSAMVEQVRQLKSTDMNMLHNERKIEWQDRIYPLHYLSQLLTDKEVIQENHARNSVLLLRSGEYRIALHVDELLGNQEAVVKNIGPQLARLSGIAGATVLGNGVVVLILNPPQLAQRAGISKVSKVVKAETPESVKPLVNLPLIMVVDDSLTVRKITSRMLTRAGYQVVTATDGVDALEKLEDFTPDVMLLDIEMPRMDGFALARELRRDPRTQSLPIIMITSRTADKHRDYAMQLGVNTYLGKPYQEDELLQNIADFVAEHKLDA
jgi:chemosensory pili system protein ChpA (sensor histidine kinase/response regulator)